MPYINSSEIWSEEFLVSPAIMDGVHFAHQAVEFAHLGFIAETKEMKRPQYHLFALAIELSLKSLAIRSDATPSECKKAGHKLADLIQLIENKGTTVPDSIKIRISDDDWFKSFFLLSRYPVISEEMESLKEKSLKNSLLLHDNYPGMIAEILETPCKWPLEFERGSAIEEIKNPPSDTRRLAYFETKN